MHKVSIRTRLIWSIALLLALLTIVAALSYRGFQSISASAHDLVDRKARLAFLSDRANQNAQTAASILLRLLLTTDREERVNLYASMDQALNANEQALRQIEAASDEYEDPSKVRDLGQLKQRYGELFQETVEQIELDGPMSALGHFKTQTEPALKALLEATAGVALVQQDAMQLEAERLSAQAETAQLRIVLIGVLTLLVGAVLGAVIARSITVPLDQAAQLADSIASGDYTREIPVVGRDEIASMLRALGAMRDRIAEREAHIHRIAYVDSLTGLPNRNRFFEDFAQFQGPEGALLLIDIDRFSSINDALGHAVGDALLKGVAERLRAEMGSRDRLARLWGDEFVVMLCGADNETTITAADRIRAVLTEPITVADQRLDLQVSIGISRFPADGTDPTRLMRLADNALRNAKRRHTGIALAQPASPEPAPEQLTLIGEMRRALEQNHFEVFYQPKMALASGRIAGAEALIRWRHPERGLVSPGLFIPFAEQTGFIREITPWLVQRVIEDTARLRSAGVDLVVSANLSTHDLLNMDLVTTVKNALEREQLPPASLCLEITESALMEDPDCARENLQQLAAHGIKLAIDDYGSGQASLAYVRDLPIHELKIDRMFITDVHMTPKNAAIVRSTVLLCRELQLVVVAEGAEQTGEMDWLRENHCDLVQGYAVAKPMPFPEMCAWVLARNLASAETS